MLQRSEQAMALGEPRSRDPEPGWTRTARWDATGPSFVSSRGYAAGGMFWFTRKRLSGSYWALIEASRSYVAPG